MSSISSEPDMFTDAPVANPCCACVTFTTPLPCCVANGSSSNSTSKSSFSVTVTTVAEVYPVTVASVPYIFTVVPT